VCDLVTAAAVLERIHTQNLMAAAASAPAPAKKDDEDEDDLYRLFVKNDAALLSQRYEELMDHAKWVTYRGRPVVSTLMRMSQAVKDASSDEKRLALKTHVFLHCARLDRDYWAAFGQRCRASRFHMLTDHLKTAFNVMIRKCIKADGPEFQSPLAFLADVSHKILSNYDPYGRYEKLYSHRIMAQPGSPIKLTTMLP